MTEKRQEVELVIDKIVNGGQALASDNDGRKVFVWGAIPGDKIRALVTRRKSNYLDAIVTTILDSASERIAPLDPDSYLSTSPWQIMTFDAEQRYKSQLIREAFAGQKIDLAQSDEIYSDERLIGYRNKVEFSWFSDTKYSEKGSSTPHLVSDTLDLAFFRRGSKGKIVVESSSLLPDSIMELAIALRDLLRTKNISARSLKTLLIRSNQAGQAVWQLYLKDKLPDIISPTEAAKLPAIGGELIYSNPKSPASVITGRLASFGETTLSDELLEVPFRYAVEGFFQVNLPVYEQALTDIAKYVPDNQPVVDLYSGVGTIGLTVTQNQLTLVESNPDAVREMKQNIKDLGRESTATAVLSTSESALDYITSDSTIIVDPPRAGLHTKVIERLLETAPSRIIYLSCNPVTQARDVAMLQGKYQISHSRGYNFFPRTPHIENLVILDSL